jgi:glutathione synthase/RimK-type ligase-like ATP-grasp enzyme
VVRSTWDYTDRREEFLAWARGVARLENPYPVLAYSSDKVYLADLATRGWPIVSSRFCDVGASATFPDGRFVVKPRVGAGSRDAERYAPGEEARARAHVAALHARGRDVVIQPYVESVDVVGERALVFVEGALTHALTKAAMLVAPPDARDALFRREQMSIVTPEPEAVELATRLLADEGYGDLLYARVDLVATPEGWAVMELELVEPSLFLSFDAAAARALANAIARRSHRSGLVAG